MFKGRSLVTVMAAVIAGAGLLPVIVAGLLGGSVIALLAGVVVLAITAAGGAYGVVRQMQPPLAELTRAAEQIAEAAKTESGDRITPHLRQLESMQAGPDVGNFTLAFKQMVTVFQHRMTEYNSLYAMGQAITAKVDFEQTVQAVLDAVKQVVEFDAAEVSVLRGDDLVVEAWVGQADFNNTTGRKYKVGRGPTGLIAANKAPVLISTLSGTEEDMRRTLGYESMAGEFLTKTHKVMINSFLGIPLLIGERLIGTLTLVHREPGRFTEDERWQLNKLAGQASIAMDNAIQVKQREEALKAQIRELKVEIDAGRINEEVDQITGSDYFQTLQAHAAKIRSRVYTKDRRRSAEAADLPSDTAAPPERLE
jgi:GAF domain-containing protein